MLAGNGLPIKRVGGMCVSLFLLLPPFCRPIAIESEDEELVSS